MNNLLQDLKYSVRIMISKPIFAAVAILSLALGIGACTTIFSVIDAVLLRSLAYPKPEQVMFVNEVNERGMLINFTDPNFLDIRNSNQSLAGIAEFQSNVMTVLGGAQPVRARVATVSGDFIKVMGVAPVMGRDFNAEELRMGGTLSAIVSHGFWQKMLGAPLELSGKTIRVDNKIFNVVGVMPEGFSYPANSEIWQPREVIQPMNTSRSAHNWQAIARLRDGVPLAQARAELTSLAQQLKKTYGQEMSAVNFSLTPLQEFIVQDVRKSLLIGFAAVAFLLLIACANAANLLLALASSRQKEIAVRLALGANRWRMMQQFITESLLLVMIAATIGTLISLWGVDWLISLNREGLPRSEEIGVDWRVLIFTIGLSVLVAIALGVFVALRGSKVDVQGSLKEAGRGVSASRASGKIRSFLVVSQIAATVILLVGAGLLVKSFTNLMKIDPGFQTENALVMELDLPYPIATKPEEERTGYQKIVQFHEQVLERLRQLPEVTSVGGINSLPMTDKGSNGSFQLLNSATKKGYAEQRIATRDYFKTMGMKLLSGRVFDESDKPEALHAAIINEAAAKKIWAGEEPLGKQIQWSNMDGDEHVIQVVGVVSDVREFGLSEKVLPTIYLSSLQRPYQAAEFSFVIRSTAATENLVPTIRREIARMNPELPVEFKTLEKIFSSSLDQRRFNLMIFVVFSSVALLLAIAGIYGVVSYNVTQRTNEIGVRMALGAQMKDVLKLVIGHGIGLVVIGILIGLAGAAALTKVMQSLLFSVSVYDPATFAAVGILLAMVALVACYFPARRATKVDPNVALRYE